MYSRRHPLKTAALPRRPRRGMAGNTIVAFISDHGDFMGERRGRLRQWWKW